MIIRSFERIIRRKRNNFFLFFFFFCTQSYQISVNISISCVKRDIRVSQRKKERNNLYVCNYLVAAGDECLPRNLGNDIWHIKRTRGWRCFAIIWPAVTARSFKENFNRFLEKYLYSLRSREEGRGGALFQGSSLAVKACIMMSLVRHLASRFFSSYDGRNCSNYIVEKITDIFPLCRLFFFLLNEK